MVKITDQPSEAAYFAANHIPYIVHLNESNRGGSFPSGSFCVENLSDLDDAYLEKAYRRAKGLPWEIARTERLVIREITVEDVPGLYELYADASITQYMEPLFADLQQEIEYTREYIQNIYGFYGYGMWVILLKDSGELIGRVGLESREGLEGLELGFMLGVPYQHNGYAYEACSAALAYGAAQLGQEKYYAVVHAENERSKKLCERLGLRAVCRRREDGEGYIRYGMNIKNIKKY